MRISDWSSDVCSSDLDFRLVALRYDAQTIYRFTFVSASERSAALNVPFRETTYSFRKLSEAEAAKLKPRRVRIYEVKAGDTPAKIEARIPFAEENLKRFLLLNGLPKTATLTPSHRPKITTAKAQPPHKKK